MEPPEGASTRPKRKRRPPKLAERDQFIAEARAAADAAELAAATPAATEDSFHTIYRQKSLCTVTVAHAVRNKGTSYGTGFILFSYNCCSLIFTSSYRREYNQKGEYFIYFSDKIKHKAEIFLQDHSIPFIVLVVKDVINRLAVTFSNTDAKYEAVTIIGAMGGTKNGFNSGFVDGMDGVLGNYKGLIFEPSCEAYDTWGEDYEGSEMFFMVRCTMQDDILPLPEINHADKHQANAMLAAPVFRLADGEIIGVLYSKGDCDDIKIGAHIRHINNILNALCKSDDWKEVIKTKVVTKVKQWQRNHA